MSRRELDKLKFLCLKAKIRFHTRKIVDGNYAILISEERRHHTEEFKTFQLARERIEKIIWLRTNWQPGR